MARHKVDPFLFDENEKLILRALRTNSTPLKIAQATSIPRTTIYFVLNKLKIRGLAKSERIGRKKIWLLKSFSEEKISDENDCSYKDENIKVYSGKDEMIMFLENLIQNDHIKFQSFGGDNSSDSWSKNVGNENIVKFNNMIRDNNVISDLISSDKFLRDNAKTLGEQWSESFKNKPTEYHLIDSKYTDNKSQIILKNGKVFIINMENPVVLEIKDKDIYQCFVSIFDFIKDHSRKVNVADYLTPPKK